MFILFTYSCVLNMTSIQNSKPEQFTLIQTSFIKHLFILYEFVLRHNDGEDSDRTCSFGIHTLGEDTVYSPEKTSKHINEMTGQGTYFMKRIKKGLR